MCYVGYKFLGSNAEKISNLDPLIGNMEKDVIGSQEQVIMDGKHERVVYCGCNECNRD